MKKTLVLVWFVCCYSFAYGAYKDEGKQSFLCQEDKIEAHQKMVEQAFNANDTSFFAREKVDINLQGDKGNTALHGAAWDNDCKLLQFLLGVPGINPNIQNKVGSTPLIFASFLYHKDVYIWLLNDSRVKRDIANKAGLTAYDYFKDHWKNKNKN